MTKDFPKILELQRQNLLQNLHPGDRQDGFLTIEYSTGQLEQLNHELGIFVARENDHLAGYLIAQKMDFAVQSPLISTMVKRLPDLRYGLRPVSELRTFIYGPVCIDKKSRGLGVLEGLFRVLFRAFKGHYDLGIAFVSERNPRSLHAHLVKLKMEMMDEFEFGGQRYITLVFDVSR